MAATVWALLVLLGGAAYIGWRLHAYPGGWAYAFGDAYAVERRDLAMARRGVRELERAARRELSEAKGKVRGEETRYRERIRSAEQRLKELRNPGRGEQQQILGELTLYQHVLRYRSEDIPLAGLKVRFESARHKYGIKVTRPNGRAVVARFPGTQSEDAVRHFAIRIENAVADENDLLTRRKGLIADAETELTHARASTLSQEAAREALVRLTARQSADDRLPAARAELDAARGRWHAETGHLPRT
ncbi:hypothetical protein [Streptomyces sp. NBC_01262]|uniref:hypothetical protein n=1 Tax=Streptomyces sp. NBC_01262 TaxID=2903803 RepID=UPI002E30BA40|nr:hypothetical protein [Streptomyces sp. NBC_01262]